MILSPDTLTTPLKIYSRDQKDQILDQVLNQIPDLKKDRITGQTKDRIDRAAKVMSKVLLSMIWKKTQI
jgi:hypothetical protein